MDLSSGAKRLTNRKRAQPATLKKKKVGRPEVQLSTLPTPVYGADVAALQKQFTDLPADEVGGIKVTRQEKDFISSKALQQKRELPEFEITDIVYTLLSHEELKSLAVFDARNTDSTGTFSINDPRGGTVDKNSLCSTCELDNLSCPGHFGIITLNEPIIHPMFRREIVDILTSVCGSCGGLLLPIDTIREKGFLKLSGSKRLRAIAEASKGFACRRNVADVEEDVTACISNPTYLTDKLKDTGKIYYTREKKKKSVENFKSIDEVVAILDSITTEEAEILGFSGDSHPSRFIMRSLPVIPLCARASVIQDGEIMADDLTSMYHDIIRINNELSKDLPEAERENKIKSLTWSIEHMINNADKKYGQGKSKVYQSLKDRIQGKEGLIRSHLMGKRVNFSARTVIGPDPTLKFGQIRVPRSMAPYLSQHEIITPENLKKMTSLLRNGRITYIIPSTGRSTGQRIKVTKKIQNTHELVLGDEVDRWLENGDWVVFNRQPTLHKQGIMGYEVVLGDTMTIGLHLGVTRQHNADFDGDESNLFAPQSEEARQEVAGVMSASCNIMNAQTNDNVAGVVFDALTSSYILSLPETRVDADVFMNLRMNMDDDSAFSDLYQRLEKYSVDKNSGRALLSALFPNDFYYKKGETEIKEGILVSGVLNKSNIGSSPGSGSIIQALYKDYGVNRTTQFLTDIYHAGGYFMDTYGFSVGMDDCFLTGEDPQKTIDYEVQKAKMLVKSMGTKLQDPLEEERRENQIRAYLDTAKNFGTKISKEKLSADNSFNVMAKSGAKGSVTNIAQITGILGQQFLSGERMPESISGGTRTLPYFPQGEIDPAARGFVQNSFLSGLTPAELFFVFAGGRVGLTDTAISTATTGFIHHKIAKSLEDIKVVEDGSVRNSANAIYQYSYGEDGFNAAELEKVTTKTGTFTSFIDLKRVAGRINTKYGF